MEICTFCNEDTGFNEDDFDSSREAFIEHLSDKHQVSFNFDFLYFTSLIKSSTLVKLVSSVTSINSEIKQTENENKNSQKGERFPGIIYKCDKCDYRSVKLNGLSMHTKRRHTNIRTKECIICSDRFLTKEELKTHMIVHTMEKNFSCEICPSAFKHKSTLNQHIVKHAGKNKQFKCDYCAKSFGSRNHLSRHIFNHTGIKPYNCGSCSSSFALKEVLKDHTMRKHTGIRPHKCPDCDKRFVSSSEMKHHGLVHSDKRDFQCEQCEASFKDRETLKTHMKRHLGIKSEACVLCFKTFIDKGKLSRHMKSVHSATKNYHCTKCSQSFTQNDNLKQHVRFVHDKEKNEACGECGRKFALRATLRDHMANVHGIGEVKFLDCPKCYGNNKGYKGKKALQKHIKYVHDKLKPYNCDVCDVSFSESSKLKRHLGGGQHKNKQKT